MLPRARLPLVTVTAVVIAAWCPPLRAQSADLVSVGAQYMPGAKMNRTPGAFKSVRTMSRPTFRCRSVRRRRTFSKRLALGRGLVHRDIKPANIVLSERGGILDFATILDFGLAREIDRPKDAGATSDGKIIGTPLYLAPESILSADAADARSDIYALGAVAYFMLTAETVFGGASVVEVCSHHLHSPVVPPSRRSSRAVPSDLEALVLRCLAKSPADRPSSAKALESELAALEVEAWTATDASAWWDEHRGLV